ncbi:four helix bundle protein [Bdellovibrio svalbardensis]|uniref:Four helix bundle protein n=1 Tax=Bdellovibrio svalbardensis TaxID=2972972 RepID=A0ABT6DK00_9BACT|nr:four helix bundle protein [Bdellovibrio svalbardensis]MDG0817196.1 four helix bundle protein [Bdellovibrio svalbardensis]
MAFPFENLDVYKRSIEFNTAIASILERKGITRTLTDQLSRAALSIPLNIAEGNGRWHKGDKRQFFWIARGSVFECVPLIEILTIKKILTTEENETFREQLEVLGKMLTKLAQINEVDNSTV